MKNSPAADSTLRYRFDVIGKPDKLKIFLVMDGVDVGFRLVEGRWFRDVRWDIIGTTLVAIYDEYQRNGGLVSGIHSFDYRLAV